MAMIVRFAVVIAQPFHGVAFDDMFRVVLHKLLGAVPKGLDGLDVLVQTKDETVLLAIVAHILERIIVHVAEELDTWFHAPIPLIFIHQGLPKKEAGFKAAHVPVADGIPVDDLSLRHILPDLGSLVLVDKVWEGPVLLRNIAIVCFPRNERCCDSFKFRVERLVVEEHPIVVILPIEPILHRADGFDDLPKIRVPC